MAPEAAALRRATRGTLALAAGTLLGVGVLFGLVLHPVVPEGCTTGLYPGAYADALVPVHAAAFLLLVALATWLGARRDDRRRPPARALGALAAMAAGVGALALVPGLWVAPLVLGPVAGLALLVAGALHTLAAERAHLAPAERWRRHARIAEVALWTAAGLVLPALFAAFWVHGAGLFCF
jgi:hypothetical protein